MSIPLSVLLVEDSPEDAEFIMREIRRGGYEPNFQRVENATQMSTALAEQVWDVVIADYNLPHFSAVHALTLLKETGFDLPFIIVSGNIGEDVAVAAMKAGADDYLMKNNLARLVPAIERELGEALNRSTHRRAEEALRESAERYRVLFQHAPEAIVLHDCDTERLSEANPEAERLFGLSASRLRLRSPWTLSPDLQPDGSISRDRAIEYIERALAGETPRFEWTHLRSDGTEIPCEVSLAAFQIGHRRVVQGAIRDITERKAAESRLAASREELAQRVDELQRVNLEIETFLYTVSHDLKAPLVTLHGMTELLMASGGKWMGVKERHYVERMRANVAHMQRLVEDLLDLARLGRTREKIETFDVVEAARAAIEQLSGVFSAKRAEVILPDRLGQTRYDRRRLIQVLANLLSNAVQYSHPDRAPRVEIKGKPEGDALVIEIRDNGIGIEERHFDRIFEIFEKVSPGGGEGTGVGLSIVKKIVELYGGRVWVQSEPGVGSAFYFTVPKA